MRLPKDCTRGGGFTLIELVLSMGILVFLSGVGLFMAMDVYRDYALRAERTMVGSILAKARSMALANINQTPHGVYLQSNAYVLFQGSSYASRTSSYDEIILSNPAVSTSGIQEIVFRQLRGDSNASGTITFTDMRRSFSLFVNGEGRISW